MFLACDISPSPLTVKNLHIHNTNDLAEQNS